MKIWKDLKLGLKITIGFVIVILLTSIVGIVGINSLWQVGKYELNLETGYKIMQALSEARRYETSYILQKDAANNEEIIQYSTYIKNMKEGINQLKSNFNNASLSKVYK